MAKSLQLLLIGQGEELGGGQQRAILIDLGCQRNFPAFDAIAVKGAFYRFVVNIVRQSFAVEVPVFEGEAGSDVEAGIEGNVEICAAPGK